MTQAQLPYVLLYLCSTFLASVSQVLLKKAALREHKTLLEEYTDWRVILGYGLFVGCTLLTMLAYKGVPLNVGPVLEATGYLYVTIFGVTIFHEKMNPKKIAARDRVGVCFILTTVKMEKNTRRWGDPHGRFWFCNQKNSFTTIPASAAVCGPAAAGGPGAKPRAGTRWRHNPAPEPTGCRTPRQSRCAVSATW